MRDETVMWIPLPLPNKLLCSIIWLDKPLANSNKITRQKTPENRKTAYSHDSNCTHFMILPLNS